MLVKPSPLRVLIGDVAQEDARLRSILHGDELHFVRTGGEMERALDARPFDLGVVCLQFDESRMFEALRYLRERNGARLPVACIRGDSATRQTYNMERYREPLASLGADALIDFRAIPDGSAGNDHIRRLLYGCVPQDERTGKSTVYTRALQSASEKLGGTLGLMGALNVTLGELAAWMRGEDFPPYRVFMAALDVAANAAGMLGVPGAQKDQRPDDLRAQ
jgi:hypothetical protein